MNNHNPMYALNPSLNIIATVFFACALLHTFLAAKFQQMAHRFVQGSILDNTFHLLGEIEVIFGVWAGLFLCVLALMSGTQQAINYLNSQNFTEPVFVFVVMTVASTKPILQAARHLIMALSKLIPLPLSLSFYITTLILGPVLGSVITEPAAMTVLAWLLRDQFYRQAVSRKFMYATLGLLFVNVSIGGTLTPYAAPPVLMVARAWGFDLSFMLTHFGYKAIIAISLSTLFTALRFKQEILKTASTHHTHSAQDRLPWGMVLIHVVFLALIILTAHHIAVFLWLFLFFLGLMRVSKAYQDVPKMKEALLVAFFLSGLIVLGGPQQWWLAPLLAHLTSFSLFISALILTAITDNAALTYLGSLVPHLSKASQYALLAGAVTGGGLTLIANAPNLVGYGILNEAFEEEGIGAVDLFLAALLPTIIAAICFWCLPT